MRRYVQRSLRHRVAVAANRYYAGPPSDHFDGTRFFNPHHPGTDRSLSDLLRWRFGTGRAPWPAHTPIRPAVPDPRVDGLRITMVGHATVLIQSAGLNILADPVWSARASPVPWAGPARVNEPGVAWADLPPIDVVLLTHNHYDHLDIATLKRLWDRDRPRIIAPLGNDAVVARTHPAIQVDTYDWRDTASLGEAASVRLHPANHWSARGAGDRRMALWCGYVITTRAGTVYLAGDTGYGDGRIFREVRQSGPPVDVAILPIGAYAPRWFMHDQHADPAEAVQIMLDCGAAQALGIHWGTFRLTDEARLAPPVALRAELTRLGLDEGCFAALEPGGVWERRSD